MQIRTLLKYWTNSRGEAVSTYQGLNFYDSMAKRFNPQHIISLKNFVGILKCSHLIILKSPLQKAEKLCYDIANLVGSQDTFAAIPD